MKKFFLFAAAVAAALSVNAETLTFEADTVKTAGTWSNGYKWELNTFDVMLVDTKGKFQIDANNAYFGDAENYVKLEASLKTGGKTATSGENSIMIKAYQSEKLYIAARTGSNSATDRNIIVTQDGKELINKILLESEAVKVKGMDKDNPEKETNIYPILSCDVTAGDIVISYPVNGVNIYAIALGGGIEHGASQGIDNVEAVKAEKFYRDGQLIIRKNGVEYNALGAKL